MSCHRARIEQEPGIDAPGASDILNCASTRTGVSGVSTDGTKSA